MIATVMSTFVSTTVPCARSHDHKFDPVSMDDYYSLQAVFSGVDKVDRSYDLNVQVAKRREQLLDEKAKLDRGQLPHLLPNRLLLADLEQQLRRGQPGFTPESTGTANSDRCFCHVCLPVIRTRSCRRVYCMPSSILTEQPN